jgi:bacteriocin biosynthesis cyclodehydratase domain-containing protein
VLVVNGEEEQLTFHKIIHSRELSARPATLNHVRPALKVGLLPVWRDRDTLQIGIDPRRAVALTGMSDAGWVISLLDGSRDRAQVIAAAGERGIPPQLADRVLTLLAAGGALDDFPAGTYRALPRPLRARLAPELAAASLAHGDGDGGARILARRQAACLSVHVGGRLGGVIADVLAASGIGHVTRADAAGADAGAASKAQQAQGGRQPAGPARRGGVPGSGPARPRSARPDLAVLTGAPSPELAARLMREQIPHLTASAGEAIGVVGPLVIPGQSACLRCLDLARTDRDPAWPLILAQLAGRQPDPPACDAALAAAVAAQAAAQVLTFIDRPHHRTGPVTNGTLELVLPAWQWRRRTWRPHPDCACGRRAPASGE